MQILLEQKLLWTKPDSPMIVSFRKAIGENIQFNKRMRFIVYAHLPFLR